MFAWGVCRGTAGQGTSGRGTAGRGGLTCRLCWVIAYEVAISISDPAIYLYILRQQSGRRPLKSSNSPKSRIW
jgi:hypothetical protein